MKRFIRPIFCVIFLIICILHYKNSTKEESSEHCADTIPAETDTISVKKDNYIEKDDTCIKRECVADTFTIEEVSSQKQEEIYEYGDFESVYSDEAYQGTPVDKRTEQNTQFDTTFKSIHIFVALCDNVHQGIVPVPASIGNGQKPSTNLYWGCGYGIKTYFKKSQEWKLLKTSSINDTVMERLVFKHVNQNYYLVADAYNGKYIAQCISDFLSSACGRWKDTVHINNDLTIGCCGNAQLVSYIGHDGLMEHIIADTFANVDGKKRDIIILACISREYFTPYLEPSNVNPLVWTRELMAPEAYTIHDAITGYVKGESDQQILDRAIEAYASHQKKCGIKGAKAILTTGWKKK